MEKTKIVYNACYGGFGLSMKAMQRYAELTGYSFKIKKSKIAGEYYEMKDKDGEDVFEHLIDRDDPFLAQVVEELGDEANGNFSALRIRKLLKGTLYYINVCDGLETVITENELIWEVA